MTDPRAELPIFHTRSVKPARVLAVDDDATSRRLLARTLEASGYVVATACDGREALNFAAEDPPEIMLLDFQMPGMSGVEVCASLRHHAHAALREIPIIMLTALDDDGAEVACLHAGANDFVTKPVSRASLVARIETQLRLNSLNSVLRAQNEELARWRGAQIADLDAAQRVQRAILPATELPHDWHLTTHFAPLIQVGGEMHGVEAGAGGATLWLADATGHGVAAALCTTLVTIFFQRAALATDDPQEVLARVNAGLFRIFHGATMMSGACARLSEDGSICFAGAGHPPLLVRRRTGDVESIASRSTLLGLREDFSGASERVRLERGDLALLFTDGLFSARTPEGERQMISEVAPAFAKHHSLESLIRAMRGSGAFDDDVTALLLQREGE